MTNTDKYLGTNTAINYCAVQKYIIWWMIYSLTQYKLWLKCVKYLCIILLKMYIHKIKLIKFFLLKQFTVRINCKL
jgi:hypothetical protein